MIDGMANALNTWGVYSIAYRTFAFLVLASLISSLLVKAKNPASLSKPRDLVNLWLFAALLVITQSELVVLSISEGLKNVNSIFSAHVLSFILPLLALQVVAEEHSVIDRPLLRFCLVVAGVQAIVFAVDIVWFSRPDLSLGVMMLCFFASIIAVAQHHARVKVKRRAEAQHESSIGAKEV